MALMHQLWCLCCAQLGFASTSFLLTYLHPLPPPPHTHTLIPTPACLQTIMANGGFGMSVITALTAQNSRGVQAVQLTPEPFLAQQLDSILSDLPPAAIKTGMLPNAAAVQTVADKLRQYYGSSGGSSGGGSSGRQPPLVIDPVLISTSGHALAGGGVGAALKEHLAPLATMLTPNITEAEALWGEQESKAGSVLGRRGVM